MLWIAIYLPDLPVQVFCRADPDDTPLVVCAPGPRRAVLAANAAALDCGIAPGCSLASALALAPQARTLDRSPRGESALLTELACWALQFTPQVCFDAPHGLVLEVAASLNLFGGLGALLDRVREGAKALGVNTQLSCAPTPLAASWLARSGCDAVCTELNQLPAALAPLPLACVTDEPATQKLFAGLGSHRLGDCYPLPRAGLAQRGRQAFLTQIDRALGRVADPRLPWVPPPKFHARIELPCAMERADALLFGCRRMLTALSGALAARQRSIERFTLGFEHDDLPPTTLEIHLGQACRDETRFTLLAREHLSARALPAPAVAITVDAEHWLEAPGVNDTLFPDLSDTAQARSVLIARLTARLGPDAVRQIDVHADHRPEFCTTTVSPGALCHTTAQPPPRPLWLLDPPAHMGTHHTPWGPHKLTRISGPERIETGWWDGSDVARDYYIARDQDGGLLWVFQQLRAPHDWFVHGLFS